MDLELAGKRALVTGGSRGIGRQIARQLALEGAQVAIVARDIDRLKATADEIAKEAGTPVTTAVVDTTDDESVREMGAKVANDLGGIDILVNCAARRGGGPSLSYDTTTPEILEIEFNTKVMGYLRCAQVAAPHMVKNGWGRIINISGLAARGGGSIAVTTRNAAVVALTKTLADELAPHGINVNTVHPGATRTEATKTDNVPNNLIHRMVDAQEVAYVVAFLCSPKSVAIAGDVISVGGGVPRSIYY